MTDELEVIVRELKDRQEIYDCLMRYCRGLDRLDRESLESVYHPDGVDIHGGYKGPASGFIDFVLDHHIKTQRTSHHSISNFYCELDGDVAHVESYWTYSAIHIEPPHNVRFSGRYIDRFERRDGRWAIAVRVCVMDTTDLTSDPMGELKELSRFIPIARNRSDPSYQRPLVADPSIFTPPRPAKR